MNSFDQLTQQLREALEKCPSLQQVHIQPAFPPQKRPFPLRTPTLCISIKEITVEEGGLGGVVSDPQIGTISGQRCTLDFSIDILCPISHGTSGCQTIFSNLCNAIFSEENLPVRATRLGASSPEYNKENDCFLQQCVLHTSILMTTEETGLPITDFVIRRA